jgi:hypothetical protein
MSWSKFTIENITYFKDLKLSLNKLNPLLIEIKNEQKKIFNFISSNKLDISIKNLSKIEKINLNKTINKLANVDWVDSANLRDDMCNLNKIYLITWKTLNVKNDDINLVNNTNNQMYIKTTTITIKKIIKRIKFLIYICEYLKYKSNNINKVLNSFIILSNLKKNFPKKNNIIKVRNVNGGYTDLNENIIFVWRYEEFEKVFLHEMIHFFNMDSRDEHIKIKLNINGPSSFFEAVTDFWAIFYHLIYLSMITGIQIKNLLEFELAFVENQAMILNDHFKLGSWKYNFNYQVNQTTPALSYYILKYMLFKYFMENKLLEINNYNQVLNKIIRLGFIQKKYVNIESSRMSLLQLD